MDDKKNTTENKIVKSENTDELLTRAVDTLNSLAQNKDDQLKDKILNLARLARPQIKGLEGPAQVTIPQIYIRQPTSSSDSIPDTCKIGDFYSSEGENLEEAVQFIPILAHRTRKKWADEGKRIDCMSFDGDNGSRYGKCDGCVFGTFVDGKKTLCSSGHTFFVVTEDLMSIYKIDLLKTSSKAGRNILRLTKPPALWARSFTVTTENVKGSQQNYYFVNSTATGETIDEEKQEICEALHGFFQAQYIQAQEIQHRFTERDTSGTPNEQAVVVEDASEGDGIDFEGSM